MYLKPCSELTHILCWEHIHSAQTVVHVDLQNNGAQIFGAWGRSVQIFIYGPVQRLFGDFCRTIQANIPLYAPTLFLVLTYIRFVYN